MTYWLAGSVVLALSSLSPLVLPLWPSAGFALAATLIWGGLVLPGVLIGALLVQLNTHGLLVVEVSLWREVLSALITALGATTGAWFGAKLTKRHLRSGFGFVNSRSIVLFLILGGWVSTLLSPTVKFVIGQVLIPAQQGEHPWLNWFSWWIGEGIGVIVFAPIILLWFARRRNCNQAHPAKVVFPSLALLLLLLVGLVRSEGLARANEVYRLQERLLDIAERISGRIDLHSEILKSTISLREASEYVSPDEYRAFTRLSVAQNPEIQALEWAPLVCLSERRQFELEGKQQLGLDSFQIKERFASGELGKAGERPRYAPVTYVEPVKGNRQALGYDLLSSPERATTLELASAAKTTLMSSPVQLVQQETPGEYGALLVYPSFNRQSQLDGYAVGVYRLRDLFERLFASGLGSRWNLSVADVTTEGISYPLVQRGSHDAESSSLLEPVIFDVAGRRWELIGFPEAGFGENSFFSLGLMAPVSMMGLLLISTASEAFLLLWSVAETQVNLRASQSEKAANRDELTGLLNRRGFQSCFEKIVARNNLEQGRAASSLLFIDLDGFKSVNDVAGHDVGDDLLIRIARAIQSNVRERDLVARLGGDEFAVLLPNCQPDVAASMASKMIQSIQAVQLSTVHGLMGVGASIGIAEVISEGTQPIRSSMKLADDACYRVKRRGKGGYEIARRSSES